MRILLTNDDGIFAPGLQDLWLQLRRVAEVTVVAPDRELSGVGHAISMRKPILCHRVERSNGFAGFALEGTPADCVKIGLTQLMQERADLVVSGINLGANSGVHVLYSGTVSAAIEGAMAGVPSIAVSLTWSEHPDFDRAAGVVVPLVTRLKELAGSRGVTFSINIPAGAGPFRGVRIARQSCIPVADQYVRRTDPRGRVYFWIEGDGNVSKAEPDSDRAGLAEDWITITPLRYDLTDELLLETLSAVTCWDRAGEGSKGRPGRAQKSRKGKGRG